ncbi:MAG: putative lipid II flippase FtsW [Chloroflexota bacterium]
MVSRRTRRQATLFSRLGSQLRDALQNSRGVRRAQGQIDFTLLAVVAVLLILGIDMVYSASFIIAHNSPLYQSDVYFLTRQVIWVAVGAVGMFITMNIDYHHWRRFSVLFFVVVLLMLIAVVATPLGHSAYGAQRWLSLGPLPPVQPSEFAKLAIILYTAAWLSGRPGRAASLTHGAIPFALTVGLTGGLVLAQKDLGSAFIVIAVGACLFFIGGADVRHFLAGMVVGGAALVWAIFVADYRVDRIEAFRDPTRDPLGLGWQAIQTNIALGSGGLLGLGLGASRQKYYWLPAAHTDNIFAVIGEEVGLVGTLLVVALFVLLGYRGYRAMMAAPDDFGRLLAGGITGWITLQAVVNMAAVTSLIPFTGITLPFVSSGGSSMVVTLVSVGMLLNISRYEGVTRLGSGRRRGTTSGKVN